PLSTGLPILTRPAISDPRELEGKRLGVLTNTGQLAISVRSALNTWGVSATLVPLGHSGRSMPRSGPEGSTPARSLPTIDSWDRESTACESLTRRAPGTCPSSSGVHAD